MPPDPGPEWRHIIPVSGGADSGATAVYLHEKGPEIDWEMVFSDTGAELPECYAFLERLEEYLGRKIVRLKAEVPVNDDHPEDRWRLASGEIDLEGFIDYWGGYLPSRMQRWCTKYLKLYPFKKFLGTDRCMIFIGFTAEEAKIRKGHITGDPNHKMVYPLAWAGINDTLAFLRERGIEPPGFYEWRTRSGCYCCFFQRKQEWKGLLRNHPELFDRAQQLEEAAPRKDGAKPFGWRGEYTLQQVREEVEAEDRQGKLFPAEPDDPNDRPCMMCQI